MNITFEAIEQLGFTDHAEFYEDERFFFTRESQFPAYIVVLEWGYKRNYIKISHEFRDDVGMALCTDNMSKEMEILINQTKNLILYEGIVESMEILTQIYKTSLFVKV